MTRRVVTLAVAGLSAMACLPRPRPTPPVVVYDFGPPAEEPAVESAPRIPSPVVVRPPEAPLWIDSPGISYRLAYEDPARIRSYAYASWVSSPVRLLGELLRRRVALAVTLPARGSPQPDPDDGFILQSTVDEFTQVFDTRERSRVVLRARVALVRQLDRQVAARQTFTIERPAPTPDAPGAVRAFGETGRVLAEQVVAWLSETVTALGHDGAREVSGR